MDKAERGTPGFRARRRRLLQSLAGAVLAGPAAAQAKQLVPFQRLNSRPTLRIIVPFAPGGTSDIVARLLSARLPDALGQTVIVENRAGANGNIGIAAVARAKPDGRTLLLVSSAFVTNPAMAGDAPAYDAQAQFAPVGLVATSPDVIIVAAAGPYRRLEDLIERARREPGALSYATPGAGNSVHLGGERLWRQAGVTLLHVPYTGAGPAVMAVLGGQVDCGLAALPAAQAQLASGGLRALAVGSPQAWEGLPGVPTTAQSGFPGSETLQALFAPAGTPQADIQRLNQALRQVLAEPALAGQMRAQGFLPAGGPPEALAARVAEELPRWAEVARGLRGAH
ncbi:Bug family tripartite tricarboxylate transporter substrate binding protein [Bordetella hinzii]|uniref:Bug family tripartite tricarboxylate transporter substrate binding protein n=1 Tax=Bordetella hinzii TaxID=103855 RepID=UPI0039FDDA1A